MNSKFIKLYGPEATKHGITIRAYMIQNNKCTICGNKFIPEIRSRIMDTYYTTCANCRQKAKESRKHNIRKPVMGTERCVRCGAPCESEVSVEVGPWYARNIVYKPNRYCESCNDDRRAKAREYHNHFMYNGYSKGLIEYRPLSSYERRTDVYREAINHGYCPNCKERNNNGKSYCDDCLDKKRRQSKNDYFPRYSMATINKFKVGDIFPSNKTYEVLKRHKRDLSEQCAIVSIEYDDNNNPIRFNLKDGYYEFKENSWYRYGPRRSYANDSIYSLKYYLY